MNWKRGLGLISFLAGTFLFINAGLEITGFVIAESFNVSVSFLVGLVLIVGGIGLIVFSKDRNLEGKVLTEALDFGKMGEIEKKEYIAEKVIAHPESSKLRFGERSAAEKSTRRYMERISKIANYQTKDRRPRLPDYIEDLSKGVNVKLDYDTQKEIWDEIREIKSLRGPHGLSRLSRRFHKHPVEAKLSKKGYVYDALDATPINRADNKVGRGDWRYLFRLGNFAGIAKEGGSGKYKIIWER